MNVLPDAINKTPGSIRGLIARRRQDRRLFFALGFFIIGLLTIPRSGIHEAFLLLFLLIFASFALISFRSLALIVVSSIPLAGVLRWAGSDSVLTVSFQSVIFGIALAATLFHVVFRGRFKVNKLPLSVLLPFIPFILVVFVYVLVTVIDYPFLGVLYFREYLLPFSLFFIFYYALRKNVISVFEVISLLIAVTATIAVINLGHYFFGLASEYPRYVSVQGSSAIAETRSVFGFTLPRSQHLLGLGSQGGGSVFYAIVGSLSLLLASVLQGRSKAWAIFSAISLLVAGAYTLSGSFIMALFLIAMYLASVNIVNKKQALRGLMILLVGLGIGGLLLSVRIFQMGSQTQLFAYGQAWIERGMTLFSESPDAWRHLFGGGLGLPGEAGIARGLVELVYFDTWIFSVVPQVGLIGFLSLVASWGYWILLTVKGVGLATHRRIYYMMAAVILVGAIAYAHQAAFVARLMIPLLMLALAILASTVGSARRVVVR